MINKYLECGQIVRSHGINGAMVVSHFCDSYEVFEGLKHLCFKNGDTYVEHKVKKCSPYKNSALVVLDGIDTPEDVTKLRGSYLYAKREEILKDEDSFFIVDLIGLSVKDNKTGVEYGRLKDVINQGAQDIYVVEREDDADILIPAIPQFVNKISLEEGIYVTLIEGML
ncbi:MAG: 16S rRNA processing protein RimM [Clostridia bacterium]|nr:16S rRNA processing protein RimM [Clostridia bacterium]